MKNIFSCILSLVLLFSNELLSQHKKITSDISFIEIKNGEKLILDENREFTHIYFDIEFPDKIEIKSKNTELIVKNDKVYYNSDIEIANKDNSEIEFHNSNNKTSKKLKFIFTPNQLATNDGTRSPIESIVEFSDGDNIFLDARNLVKSKGKTKEIQNLLKLYNVNPEHIKDHIFLKEYYSSEILTTGLNPKFTNIAKADVTNFAMGMARFLADRAKQEMNESFFIQMRKQMEKVPELQFYFPESYVFLKRLDAHTISFDLDHLRARFNQDIQKLPLHIYSSTQGSFKTNLYPQLQHLKVYFENHPQGILTSYALNVVLQSQGKVNPKELLYNFAHAPARYNIESKLDGKQDEIINLINTIKLAELISNSLLSPDQSRYWVTQDEIQELFTNDPLFQTYIGLVLAKSELDLYKIEFDGVSLKQIIEQEFTHKNKVKLQELYRLKYLIQNLYFTYNELDIVVEQLKYFNSDRTVEEIYKVFNLFKSNLEIINTELFSFKGLSVNSFITNKDLFYNYVSPAIDISYNLYVKNYSVAIKELVVLLRNSSDFINKSEFVKYLEDNNSISDYAYTLLIDYLEKHNNYKYLIEAQILKEDEIKGYLKNKTLNKEALSSLLKNKKDLLYKHFIEGDYKKDFINAQSKSYSNFISRFNTYGTLIANVAVAQNSDEVKAAIEASVLPVGSSRIKRYSNWAITTNAYVGGFYGNAYYKLNDSQPRVSTFGVAAPIGVTISRGNLNFLGEKNSLSLNLQLIDLGSLVNFYYKEGDGAQLPADTKIQLGDILAPGASLSYSLCNTPFSVFGGVQYVPNLSRMETITTNTDFRPLTWRWHVGVAIDIPLFVLRTW